MKAMSDLQACVTAVLAAAQEAVSADGCARTPGQPTLQQVSFNWLVLLLP
jgi:hypothetical protein